MVYYRSSTAYYKDHLYLQYNVPLLDLITTKVTSISSHINDSFHQKLGSNQYNAPSAKTDAIRGTSKEKLYNKLGLEFLEKKMVGNCVDFLRFSGTNIECTYPILIPLLWVHTSQEILIIFLYSK